MQGPKCLVVWQRVTRPIQLGGLGVLDLTTLGYVLCMRWEWLARTDPIRLWAGILSQTEQAVRAMFEVSTTVELGNGLQTLFLARPVDCWAVRCKHHASAAPGGESPC
jgi:hypothetical protein